MSCGVTRVKMTHLNDETRGASQTRKRAIGGDSLSGAPASSSEESSRSAQSRPRARAASRCAVVAAEGMSSPGRLRAGGYVGG